MEEKFWVVVIALTLLGPLSPLSRIAYLTEGSDAPILRMTGAFVGALLRNWLIVKIVLAATGRGNSPEEEIPIVEAPQ